MLLLFAAAACAAAQSLDNATNPPTLTAVLLSDGKTYACTGSGGSVWNYSTSSGPSLCADGSVPDTSEPLASQCAAPVPICTAGQSVTQTFFSSKLDASGNRVPGTAAPFPKSYGGCTVKFDELVGCYVNPTQTGAVRDSFCTYKGKQDGTASSSGDPAPTSADVPAGATPIPAPPFNPSNGTGTCPAGTSNTGIDSSGMSICTGNGTSPGSTPTTTNTTDSGSRTTQNSDGSSTTTDSKGVTNSDGSKTTQTTTCTTAADGSKACSGTSSTGTRPDGTPGHNDRDPVTGDPKKDDSQTDNPAAVSGDLYQKGDKTFQDVMTHWNNAVSGAPFIGAAQGFLSAQVSGGSCPSWVAAVPYLKVSVDVGQYFCAPGTAEMFNIVGIGVMLGAAYVAFRIAFL